MTWAHLTLTIAVGDFQGDFDVHPDATIQDVIHHAILSFFPDEPPNHNDCDLLCGGEVLDRNSTLKELDLRNGTLLNLTVPF